MEKDKNAEIQQLRRLKDIQESIHEKELQQSNSDMRSEIKVKEERYVLLLKQIESLQNGKDSEELRRDHRDQEINSKDEEIRLITELLGKNNSDSSNNVLQETVTGILQRLSELETKPQPPLASDMLSSLFNLERKVEEPVKYSAPPMEPFQNDLD